MLISARMRALNQGASLGVVALWHRLTRTGASTQRLAYMVPAPYVGSRRRVLDLNASGARSVSPSEGAPQSRRQAGGRY